MEDYLTQNLKKKNDLSAFKFNTLAFSGQERYIFKFLKIFKN